MRKPNAGSFQPGQSGNPKGRPAASKRLDSWMNDLTGIGIWGRDKTMGSKSNVAFVPDYVTDADALQYWTGDAIAARVIEAIPNEALRQGWELQIGDDEPPSTYTPPDPEPGSTTAAPGVPAKPSTPFARKDDVDKGSKGLQETISKQLQDLGLLAHLRDAMNFERAYGGGAVLIGANDFATDLREPLDLDRVRSIDWLTSLERRELTPRYYYNDPRAPKFGQPAIYRLTPYSVGPSVDEHYLPEQFEIHESRLLIFPGLRVSRYMTSAQGQGWGASVLMRVIQALRDYQTAHMAGTQLLSDFSQAVYTINGLADMIDQDGPQALVQRMIGVDMSRSIARAILVDGGTGGSPPEKFERQSTPMGGFPEMLDRLSTRLAAACDMPLTLLMGQSPGGLNATGESDIRFFYDRVASVQALRVTPAILRMVEICLASMGEDPTQINHSVRFKSLWQPTEAETATAHFTQAQADAVYITNSVVSPEEIALSRFGGDRYSYDTHVDFDARADQEAIVAPAVDASPPPPPVIMPVNENGPMPEAAGRPSGAVAPHIDEQPAYAKGDRVECLVDHMPGMKGMTGVIAIAREGTPPYYGVKFDDQKAMPGVHKWLAQNEIKAAGKGSGGKMKMDVHAPGHQETPYSCGAAALSYALSAIGENVDEATLRALSDTTKDGANEIQLGNALQKLDVSYTESHTASFQKLMDELDAGHACLLCVDDWEHWVAIVGVLGDRVVFRDPTNTDDNIEANTIHMLTEDDLMQRWRGSTGDDLYMLVITE